MLSVNALERSSQDFSHEVSVQGFSSSEQILRGGFFFFLDALPLQQAGLLSLNTLCLHAHVVSDIGRFYKCELKSAEGWPSPSYEPDLLPCDVSM